MRLIHVDKQLVTPIYKQIVGQVEQAIVDRKLFKNDRLPSVNKVCLENQLSRDTVLFAYEELKKKGVIYAITGKGYYVKTEEFDYEQRYFLLFDELNAFKEDIYQAFITALEGKAEVDIYFHHFNLGMFRKLIHDAQGNYSKYIIMPSNLEGIESSISLLPENEVYILDQTRESLQQYPSVYQNFDKAMYEALVLGWNRIQHYERLVLVFPGNKEPLGMVSGFQRFCAEYSMPCQVMQSFNNQQPELGTVYVIPDDRDLVDVVEKTQALHWEIGKDIGLISYNDTPLKKVVAHGITTISTDFSAMGKRLATLVWEQQRVLEENPSRLILRQSL
jgi:DNA-binding transcriptional regulator YhcF (GntR family)